ncbi:hypothetical protein BKA70DRAFT_1339560 [Coprinopsis sp. MPI-PUGE-AT-0042]|nr:hypothetical protein BKA70DRAFT_1339560 [Coprinopsis sp. MPI-PUGE-AT-0042]
MSHLHYLSYPGFGKYKKESFRYNLNQAVWIGDRSECPRQGTPMLMFESHPILVSLPVSVSPRYVRWIESRHWRPRRDPCLPN